MQMPLTCWNWLVTAVLMLLGFPVLLAAGILLLLDRNAGTSFFVPGGLLINERAIAHNGGRRCCGSICSGSSATPRYTSRSCPAWGWCRR